MVYSGLQLLYKEKLRDFFYIPGLSICRPLEIRGRQVMSTAKDVFSNTVLYPNSNSLNKFFSNRIYDITMASKPLVHRL